jgi:hypothetical protein
MISLAARPIAGIRRGRETHVNHRVNPASRMKLTTVFREVQERIGERGNRPLS